MSARTYAHSDLWHPFWMDRREDILCRDGAQCVNCGSPKQLQIHHVYYEPEKNAWDYPDDALVTLCDYCHEALHRKNWNRERIEKEREAENAEN